MATSIALVTLIAVLLIAAGEAALSSFNERLLLARGAKAVGDPVLRTMMWAYPASFVAMAVEGALTGPATGTALPIGLALFGASKALKMWSITALGTRWTFRVLVLPNVPRVTRGPYAVMRHPNYLAVLGEMAAMAMIVWAPVTGVIALIGYSWVLRRKIAVEEHALGRQ